MNLPYPTPYDENDTLEMVADRYTDVYNCITSNFLALFPERDQQVPLSRKAAIMAFEILKLRCKVEALGKPTVSPATING